ncbi:MAG: hypothetical protein IJD78_04240 [Clostridia bacterium]|nr:hypothetical protein [Clostridia bacterium]
MDKNKAVFEWIKKCPVFERLYFNFGTADAGTSTFIPLPVDRTVRKDIFDNEVKQYDFAVSSFSFVDDATFDGSENIEGMAFLQQLTEWIETQNKKHDFPDFGEKCFVEKIEAVQNIPASLRMQNISKYLSQYRITYEVFN